MNTLETLKKLLETTPEDVFEERYGRRPANDWWDTRALAGAGSALRNRQGTAARKALPGLLSALEAARRVAVQDSRLVVYHFAEGIETPHETCGFCMGEDGHLDDCALQALREALSPLLREPEAGP